MPDSILQRLKTEPTPLVDQHRVTFVWRGRTAPALVGDFTGWDDGRPIRLEKLASGLWASQLSFPADAYIEYSFIRGEQTLLDPNNPRQTPNGVGGFNNFFSMAGYKPTDLARRHRHLPHGTVNEHILSTDNLIQGDERLVYLYQPPVESPVPLIVVWDGFEYLKWVRLNYLVDNLISQRRMQPVALALVSNGGQDSRTAEYACNEATLIFLVSKVLPLAHQELNLLDITAHPGAFGVLGASMGGLMALYTALRVPGVFGKVLSQSGAFTLGSFDTVVFDLLAANRKLPVDIWLDVGRYDLPGLLESNQRMRSVLQQHGDSFTYREYNAGHNYPSWRDELWRGLETLFGPPD